jgi:hypothetical protein
MKDLTPCPLAQQGFGHATWMAHDLGWAGACACGAVHGGTGGSAPQSSSESVLSAIARQRQSQESGLGGGHAQAAVDPECDDQARSDVGAQLCSQPAKISLISTVAGSFN